MHSNPLVAVFLAAGQRAFNRRVLEGFSHMVLLSAALLLRRDPDDLNTYNCTRDYVRACGQACVHARGDTSAAI